MWFANSSTTAVSPAGRLHAEVGGAVRNVQALLRGLWIFQGAQQKDAADSDQTGVTQPAHSTSFGTWHQLNQEGEPSVVWLPDTS